MANSGGPSQRPIPEESTANSGGASSRRPRADWEWGFGGGFFFRQSEAPLAGGAQGGSWEEKKHGVQSHGPLLFSLEPA